MKLWECSLHTPPCQLRTGSSLVTRFVQYVLVFLPENIYGVKEDRRKIIRLIEGNAKCHRLKN
jgi:hypothetical protein